jgi:outer membrane protein
MNKMIVHSLFAILVLAMTAAPALAEQKIAVVNIQQIMRDAKAAEAIRGQMKSKQKSFQEELDKREKELQTQDQELAKQRSVLSQEAFEKKYQEFRKKASDAQKEVRTKRAALDKGFTQALAEIQKKVLEIVEKLAKEKDVDAVISTGQMLYADPSLDLTAEVLTRLNSQMPNVNVNFN